ncbi:GSCOCG00004422001-RA-CDS [Cotesia congregata]|nr:GSCOCG00004422001-RA-CDS [Cotesia congregata]
MGLAYDANQLFKVPSNKTQIIKAVKSLESPEEEEEEIQKDRPKSKKPDKKIKKNVAMELEAEARAPRERKFRVPQNQVIFVTYMMDKYGEDYEAMARDKKNYYQLTWRQIRKQINVFKGVPEQYAEYLVKKGEIVLDDPEPLEVTKKKISEENVRKFNLPQPGSKRQMKKNKKTTKGWIEEEVRREEEKNYDDFDDDADDIDDADGLEDIHVAGQDKGGKKIQLFSDDDNDDDDEEDEDDKPEKKKKKMDDSDSDSPGELEDDQNGEFVSLSDMSDQELSEDDDAEFSSDSE